jgi:antitoxin CcdA
MPIKMESRVEQGRRRQISEAKRATNVSLSEVLLAEAKSLTVNVSRACEAGLAAEVREAKARRWQQENEAGFKAWNDYVERNGVPLADYRKF